MLEAYQTLANEYLAQIQQDSNLSDQINQHHRNLKLMVQKQQYNLPQYTEAHSFYHSTHSKIKGVKSTQAANQLVPPPLIPASNNQKQKAPPPLESDSKSQSVQPEVRCDNKKEKRKKKKSKNKFVCNICEKKLSSAKSLSNHIREIHDGNNGDIECKSDSCNRTFASEHDMERHFKHTHNTRLVFFPMINCPKCINGHLLFNEKRSRVWCSVKKCTFNQT